MKAILNFGNVLKLYIKYIRTLHIVSRLFVKRKQRLRTNVKENKIMLYDIYNSYYIELLYMYIYVYIFFSDIYFR